MDSENSKPLEPFKGYQQPMLKNGEFYVGNEKLMDHIQKDPSLWNHMIHHLDALDSNLKDFLLNSADKEQEN